GLELLPQLVDFALEPARAPRHRRHPHDHGSADEAVGGADQARSRQGLAGLHHLAVDRLEPFIVFGVFGRRRRARPAPEEAGEDQDLYESSHQLSTPASSASRCNSSTRARARSSATRIASRAKKRMVKVTMVKANGMPMPRDSVLTTVVLGWMVRQRLT